MITGLTALLHLGRVDTEKADVGLVEDNGVAINDIDGARQ